MNNWYMYLDLIDRSLAARRELYRRYFAPVTLGARAPVCATPPKPAEPPAVVPRVRPNGGNSPAEYAWTRADGTLVAISKMDDSHLTNAIRCVETGHRLNGTPCPMTAVHKATLPHMRAEQAKRARYADARVRVLGIDPGRHPGCVVTSWPYGFSANPGGGGDGSVKYKPIGVVVDPPYRAKSEGEQRKDMLHGLRDDLRKLRLRVTALETAPAAPSIGTLAARTQDLLARLVKVEAVAHAPVPVVSRSDLDRALRALLLSNMPGCRVLGRYLSSAFGLGPALP